MSTKILSIISRKKQKILLGCDIWLLTINLIIINRKLYQGKKIKYLVFITQSYFKIPKDVSLDSTNYFTMKISNEIKIQFNKLKWIICQIAWTILWRFKKKKKKKIIISQRCNFTIRKLFTFCPRQNLLERILRENHGNWEKE